jgi:hypothetical protein
MKKLSTLGIVALAAAITFVACTKNNSSTPVPNKLGSASFIKKDTVTPPHLVSPSVTKKDTVTPPIKSFSASVSLIKKDTVTPPHATPSVVRDTVTPPKTGRNP